MRGKKSSGAIPFDEDVNRFGAYRYTGPAARLSSLLANKRQSELISKYLPSDAQSLIDIGCGDGTYTAEFLASRIKVVVGVDPALNAILAARKSFPDPRLRFIHGDISSVRESFDVAVLRGVLHHAEKPLEVLRETSERAKIILILEPNGLNPALKVIERLSRYHREHGEKSFSPATLKSWLQRSGLELVSSEVGGLVPFFAPDWLAKTLERWRPLVEGFPVIRAFVCGSRLLVCKPLSTHSKS